MALITGIPYDPDANLGRAYNAFMERLEEDDWACLLDHDAMFTTRSWYTQLLGVLRRNPKAGLVGGMANRIGNRRQQAGTAVDNHDVAYHRRHGAERQRRHGEGVVDVTDGFPIGGVVMVLSKRTWRATGGFVDGLLCVDHQMHFAVRRVGRRVLLAEGLYLYHWRRARGDTKWVRSVPTAKSCPCAKMENR